MRFKLGLTGSIGMGKSTTAQMFADAGCAVWDADAAVHRLYRPGGAAVAPLSAEFPAAVQDGAVSRAALRDIIAGEPAALERIEAIVHPLVARDRGEFIDAHPDSIGVFDIPLLFETSADATMDATACVTVSRETQRDRVLARRTMSAQDLERILARQMPNEEKCARATWIIPTDTLEQTRARVQDVLKAIEQRLEHA